MCVVCRVVGGVCRIGVVVSCAGWCGGYCISAVLGGCSLPTVGDLGVG